jgi:chromosome segregation ATPase
LPAHPRERIVHGMTATSEPTPRKHRSPWLWVSGVLVLVAAGLLIWALSLQSDLDSTQQDVAELQAQAEKAQEGGGTLSAALKTAYDAITQQLGATSESLANVQADIEQAKQRADQAQQDITSAADDAAAKAQAQVQAAEAKTTIATDCAKAYVSAIGSLFEGDNIRTQLQAIRGQLQGITADCKASIGTS